MLIKSKEYFNCACSMYDPHRLDGESYNRLENVQKTQKLDLSSRSNYCRHTANVDSAAFNKSDAFLPHYLKYTSIVYLQFNMHCDANAEVVAAIMAA